MTDNSKGCSIGKYRVVHKLWGEGTVTDIAEKVITVMLAEGEKKFGREGFFDFFTTEDVELKRIITSILEPSAPAIPQHRMQDLGKNGPAASHTVRIELTEKEQDIRQREQVGNEEPRKSNVQPQPVSQASREAAFGAAERHICSLFPKGSTFSFQGKQYTVVVSGKPTCVKGEPKTDVYILARTDHGEQKEFKISYKKDNADFLENKTSPKRAKQLFGDSWQEIIMDATLRLKDKLCSRPLVYQSKFRRTQAGSITLGWKFELVNTSNGELSGVIRLETEQLLDVYAGTNLDADKQNAAVNGQTIPNSGVCNYILFENSPISTAQDVMDAIVPIAEYARENPNVFFACKALNYRTYESKYDGNRPLAVYVEWEAENGKLKPTWVFSDPLNVGGTDAYQKLAAAMKSLNIKTTEDINPKNFYYPELIRY